MYPVLCLLPGCCIICSSRETLSSRSESTAWEVKIQTITKKSKATDLPVCIASASLQQFFMSKSTLCHISQQISAVLKQKMLKAVRHCLPVLQARAAFHIMFASPKRRPQASASCCALSAALMESGVQNPPERSLSPYRTFGSRSSATESIKFCIELMIACRQQ